MQIEILEFIPQKKNSRLGYLDAKVFHSPERNETFRGLSVWVSKSGKINVSMENIKRGENWVARYERTPSIQSIMDAITTEFNLFAANNPSCFEESPLMGTSLHNG